MNKSEKGMVDVLQDKINKTIEQNQKRAAGVLDAIGEEGSSMHDFIAPLGALNKEVKMKFISNGTLKVALDKDEYSIHNHAISQAGSKLGIPTKYIKDLAQGGKWERDLAAKVLNEHSLHTDRSRVLVRSVNNQVRGILSDKYRRLNTPDIYGKFLQATSKRGAIVVDAHLDPTRSWIETIIPTIMQIETANNGIVHMVFGARIGSSDYGDGALDVRTFSMQAICLNGLVRNSVMNERHLGSRIPDNIKVSERTYKLDTMAMASLVGDTISDLLSRDNLMKQAISIQQSSEKIVDLDMEIKRLPQMGVLKHEVQAIETVLMNGKESDGVVGEPSAWKLSNAMTAMARDSEPRRMREIQEIAGRLLVKVNK